MFTIPSFHTSLRRIDFNKYTILKYVKPLTTPELGVFRSIVKYNDDIVCVSPPRSISISDFMATYPIESTLIDEFIDGTMVNAFYTDSWRICTKSNIGATSGYFDGSPCFADMFWEAAAFAGIRLDELDRKYIYSFVVQHPQNRIVCPVELNLYLIKVYEIRGNDVHEMPRPHIAKLPEQVHCESYDQLHDLATFLSYTKRGFMLHAPDGTRSKLIGHAYSNVLALRGNTPSMRFRILELRGNRDKLDQLLMYYPEFKHRATTTIQSVLRFANELYTKYLECFKQKLKPLRDYPSEIKQHLYALHNLYVTTYVPVVKRTVLEYVGKLHAAQLCAVFNAKKTVF